MNTPPPGNPSDPKRINWIDDQLAELGAACPHTQSNPNSCPLHEVRKLPAAEISKWLSGLRLEEKEYLMLYHQCCLVIRWETPPGAVPKTAPKTAPKIAPKKTPKKTLKTPRSRKRRHPA